MPRPTILIHGKANRKIRFGLRRAGAAAVCEGEPYESEPNSVYVLGLVRAPPRAFRIADARERLCTRALTIGTDTRLMLTRPFLIKNCLANSRHPPDHRLSYDMIR
jgi:hypothetical protein